MLLFQQPLKKIKGTPGEVWYSSKRPVGPRSFTTRIKATFKEAGLSGDFTLRSIRASTVNELASVGESNDVIKTRTGHTSDAAVSQYK